MNPFMRIYTGCFLLLYISSALAQPSVKDPIPLDSDVRLGKLENGFTYYIRRYRPEEKRISIVLPMKVGSVLEDDDQLGLAHFLEHMAFNGTPMFPGNSIRNYFLFKGLTFAREIGGTTSSDYTDYWLSIPSNDPGLLDTSFFYMREICQELVLDPEEIDAERGVVLGEIRSRGMSIDSRLQRQFAPAVSNFSRYAYRSPLGTTESIKEFQHAALKRFYNDWYRPDMQALVVVGDVNVAKIEETIKRIFGELKRPKRPRKKESFSSSLKTSQTIVRITDKELSRVHVLMHFKQVRKQSNDATWFRSRAFDELFGLVMEQRNIRIMQQADSLKLTFIAHLERANPGAIGSNLDAMKMGVIVDVEDLEQGFKVMLHEIKSLRDFGISESEFMRAKEKLIAKTKYASVESIAELSTRYCNHFLFNEVAPAASVGQQVKLEVAQEITQRDFNAWVAAWFNAKDRNIVLCFPDNKKEMMPGDDLLARWGQSIENKKTLPFVDPIDTMALMPRRFVEALPVGADVKKTYDPRTGLVTIVFSNGSRAVLKRIPTSNEPVVRVTAHRSGGLSLYRGAQSDTVLTIFSMLSGELGVGAFTQNELSRLKMRDDIFAYQEIKEWDEEIDGQVRTRNIEKFLQMLHQLFVAPRIDDADSLEQLAFALYKQRFKHVDDFTFLIVGDFDEEGIVPLLSKYLGGLPGKVSGGTAPDSEIMKVRKASTKSSSKDEIRYIGIEEKSFVQLKFSGDYLYNVPDNLALEVLRNVVQKKIYARLREKEGGTYSPVISTRYGASLGDQYYLYVAFECAPERVNELISAALEEIELLKTTGVTETDVREVVAAERERIREIFARGDSYGGWHTYLITQLRQGAAIDEITQYDDVLKRMTKVEVVEAAKKYLDRARLTKRIEMPIRFNN